MLRIKSAFVYILHTAYYSATELAERFNHLFLTKIETIRHELDSEIADGTSLDLLLTAEPLLIISRLATSKSNQEIVFRFLLPGSMAYAVTEGI